MAACTDQPPVLHVVCAPECAGGGTAKRPAGLPLPADVRWFDLDLPTRIEGKCGAMGMREGSGGDMELEAEQLGSGCAGMEEGDKPGGGGGGGAAVAKWTPVASHFRKADFVETLKEHGWDPQVPTIWLTGGVSVRSRCILQRRTTCFFASLTRTASPPPWSASLKAACRGIVMPAPLR